MSSHLSNLTLLFGKNRPPRAWGASMLTGRSRGLHTRARGGAVRGRTLRDRIDERLASPYLKVLGVAYRLLLLFCPSVLKTGPVALFFSYDLLRHEVS
jgi:hypothetical protein